MGEWSDMFLHVINLIPYSVIAGITIFTIWFWFREPFSIAPGLGIQLSRCIFPLSFVQNFMTTSLIILKIFLQHCASKKAGIVHVGSTLSMIRVVRIIIECAAIYTIELFVNIILYFCRDNWQFVIQAAINPSIGEIFSPFCGSLPRGYLLDSQHLLTGPYCRV
jgi:hypothetical protein